MNYKPIQLLLGLQLLSGLLIAQSKSYQLKADTVRIFSNCDTAELVLENRTKSVINGVLTNKGNGVTEFRKTMVKISDSLYVIGGDTLNAAVFGRNIYNSNGLVSSNRTVDGNSKNIQFKNNSSFLISNNAKPVVLSRTTIDSASLRLINNSASSPFTGLVVRGTGCDATIELESDTAGTCNAGLAIDFTTLRPRQDSWLTNLNPGPGAKFLLGRIQLQTSNPVADYSSLRFTIKSDTAFFKDGAYVLYTPGLPNGFTPHAIMTINPSFRHPSLGYHTKMPFVQVNGGLFVGYGRNWYYNSRNANDIIQGVDDVPGYTQAFYETRFSVYADSLPLKFFKLPAIKGNAFITYSPAKTVDGNNVAFEYKDSVYEDIRRYISLAGLSTPSDLNLKENITASQFCSSKLLDLCIRDFNYKADKNKTRYTGLIAQELKLALPELVSGKEGSYSIDYIKMVPYLLKLLQDQQKEIIKISQQQLAANAAVIPDLLATIRELQQQILAQQQEIKLLQDFQKQ